MHHDAQKAVSLEALADTIAGVDPRNAGHLATVLWDMEGLARSHALHQEARRRALRAAEMLRKAIDTQTVTTAELALAVAGETITLIQTGIQPDRPFRRAIR